MGIVQTRAEILDHEAYVAAQRRLGELGERGPELIETETGVVVLGGDLVRQSLVRVHDEPVGEAPARHA